MPEKNAPRSADGPLNSDPHTSSYCVADSPLAKRAAEIACIHHIDSQYQQLQQSVLDDNIDAFNLLLHDLVSAIKELPAVLQEDAFTRLLHTRAAALTARFQKEFYKNQSVPDLDINKIKDSLNASSLEQDFKANEFEALLTVVQHNQRKDDGTYAFQAFLKDGLLPHASQISSPLDDVIELITIK